MWVVDTVPAITKTRASFTKCFIVLFSGWSIKLAERAKLYWKTTSALSAVKKLTKSINVLDPCKPLGATQVCHQPTERRVQGAVRQLWRRTERYLIVAADEGRGLESRGLRHRLQTFLQPDTIYLSFSWRNRRILRRWLRVVDMDFLRIDSNDWAFRMRLQHENRQTGQINRNDQIYILQYCSWILAISHVNWPGLITSWYI